VTISPSSLAIAAVDSRFTVVVVNSRSNIASAAPSSRSICPGVGGSIFSCRKKDDL
jgi:hypothetical protein